MRILLNGKDHSINNTHEMIKLSGFLSTLSFDNKPIAVELNGELVPKSQYNFVELKEGDKVEIVTFVGGG